MILMSPEIRAVQSKSRKGPKIPDSSPGVHCALCICAFTFNEYRYRY
jgi:hypothetical protein